MDILFFFYPFSLRGGGGSLPCFEILDRCSFQKRYLAELYKKNTDELYRERAHVT